MTIILERTRPDRRPSAKAPAIREVCLVGDPSRNYRHIAPGGIRIEDPGPGRAEAGSRPIGIG